MRVHTLFFLVTMIMLLLQYYTVYNKKINVITNPIHSSFYLQHFQVSQTGTAIFQADTLLMVQKVNDHLSL